MEAGQSGHLVDSLSDDPHERLGQLVRLYFKQLTSGCGQDACANPHCVSNAAVQPMEPNAAAAEAIFLAKRHQSKLYLCPETLAAGDGGAVRPLSLTEILSWSDDEAEARLVERVGAVFSSPPAIAATCLKEPAPPDDPVGGLDMVALRRMAERIASVPKAAERFVSAVSSAAGGIEEFLKATASEAAPRAVMVLFESPLWLDPSHRGVLARMLQAFVAMSPANRQTLSRWFARGFTASEFASKVVVVQQFISLRCNLAFIAATDDAEVIAAVQFLAILYEANEAASHVSFKEFQNTALVESETYDIKQDFVNWANSDGFSFCHYPFVLDPHTKSLILRLESMVQMEEELRQAIMNAMVGGARQRPFFVLRVRRDHVVRDALVQIMSHEQDLKKQMRVEFVGEEGVDEGGLRKEFFQLVVAEIFDAKYGMFAYDPDERLYWFNHSSIENSSEFELLGMLVGLALYNSVLLDAHFPMVVYKKLMGVTPTLEDVKDAVYRGLKSTLELPEEQVESLSLNFQVSFESFGRIEAVDLKPGGGDIAVTAANRREYIDRYVHWMLVESVARQFESFSKGFMAVCGGPALKLFRPEELDLLISGSTGLDFEDLEKAVTYEDGYTASSPTVRLFWEVLHALPMDKKREFLKFATGSDRSPIKGLGSIRFVISRHGSDMDRLPSAHTCFNHFLLPDYKNKEKLRERLLMAIENSTGFGMM